MVDELTVARAEWWPTDKVLLAWLGAVTVLEFFVWSRLPGPELLLLLHAAGALFIVLAARHPHNAIGRAFHLWYPLLYLSYCYREMRILIPAVRGTDADAALAHLDLAIWGANPTVWLERLRSPMLAELLQIVYSGFVPAILIAGVVLWKRRRFREFRAYSFLIALGFLSSYIGYLLVPARGPRFLLQHLQTYELQGVLLFDWLRSTLDLLEAAHYDCFPSGHTEMTVLAWWGTRSISPILSRVMFFYTLAVIFATIYLRYHYTVDVMAGVVLAGVLIVIAPRTYRALESTATGGRAR